MMEWLFGKLVTFDLAKTHKMKGSDSSFIFQEAQQEAGYPGENERYKFSQWCEFRFGLQAQSI
jgi:hypothetical protein